MKTVAAMLDQPEHLVKRVINKLEVKNGYPSHDARHLAGNIQKVRIKLLQLGLDPDDTTGQELYHALSAKFKTDAAAFDLEFGSPNDVDKKIQTALGLIAKQTEMPQRWALKTSTAKQLLRLNPPKRVMKQLHYRSADSLIKRENSAEILAAAHTIESAAWNKTYRRLIGALDSSAFELRPLHLVSFPTAKWGKFGKPVLSYDNDLAVMAIMPSSGFYQTPLLSLCVMLLDGLANFIDFGISSEAARLSPILAWWQDMDDLIAHLNSEPVSLNLSDVSLDSTTQNTYEHRQLSAARKSFWHSLIGRYENQLQIEEDALLDLGNQLNNFKIPLNQPAFEFAEDI